MTQSAVVDMFFMSLPLKASPPFFSFRAVRAAGFLINGWFFGYRVHQMTALIRGYGRRPAKLEKRSPKNPIKTVMVEKAGRKSLRRGMACLYMKSYVKNDTTIQIMGKTIAALRTEKTMIFYRFHSYRSIIKRHFDYMIERQKTSLNH